MTVLRNMWVIFTILSGSMRGLAFSLFFPRNDYQQGLVRSIGALLEIDDLPVSPFSTSGKKFQLS